MIKRIWVVVSDSLKFQSGRNTAVIGITSLEIEEMQEMILL